MSSLKFCSFPRPQVLLPFLNNQFPDCPPQILEEVSNLFGTGIPILSGGVKFGIRLLINKVIASEITAEKCEDLAESIFSSLLEMAINGSQL